MAIVTSVAKNQREDAAIKKRPSGQKIVRHTCIDRRCTNIHTPAKPQKLEQQRLRCQARPHGVLEIVDRDLQQAFDLSDVLTEREERNDIAFVHPCAAVRFDDLVALFDPTNQHAFGEINVSDLLACDGEVERTSASMISASASPSEYTSRTRP